LSSLSLLNHVNPSSYASDPTFLGGRSPPPTVESTASHAVSHGRFVCGFDRPARLSQTAQRSLGGSRCRWG